MLLEPVGVPFLGRGGRALWGVILAPSPRNVSASDTGVESVPEDYHTALKLYWGTAAPA